jgi:23S rRNA (adenine2503-C2)-methyltransferase
MGLIRQLSSGEILEQVLFFARELAQQGERLTHVVLMGMGEPFHNYDACMNAIARLNHPDGFRFGARRFTVSTVGLVPGIERFAAQDSQVNLAVSLHAATDGLRDQLLPVNRRYPLGELMPACRRYVERSGRRITFEWALIRGVNDGLDQARALVELTAGLNCHVNLIPLNPTAAYDGDPAEGSSVAAFRSLLLEHGRPCTVRIRRGIDIQAGCGQLASRRRSNNPG